MEYSLYGILFVLHCLQDSRATHTHRGEKAYLLTNDSVNTENKGDNDEVKLVSKIILTL